MASVPTIKLIHRVRKDIKSKCYAVALRITYQGKPSYIQLRGHSYSKDHYTKIIHPNSKGEDRDIKKELLKYESEAKDLLETITPFDYDEFKIKFLGEEKPINEENEFTDCIKSALLQFSKRSRQSTKTAEGYKESYACLHRFNSSKRIPFKAVTLEFLRKYESYLLNERKNSYTTISIKMRKLKAVYNNAVTDGFITGEHIPFGKKKYVIPNGEARQNKALTLEEIKSVYSYQSDNEIEMRYKSFWVALLLCNGCNSIDFFSFEKKQIIDNEIVFYRKKTHTVNRANRRQIRIPITDKLQEIIDKYGNHDKDSDFIFPCFENYDAEDMKERKNRQMVKNINKYMTGVSEKLNLSFSATTYTARHSYANTLKNKGFSVEMISENLGHANIKTTQTYLSGFERDQRFDAANDLLS